MEFSAFQGIKPVRKYRKWHAAEHVIIMQYIACENLSTILRRIVNKLLGETTRTIRTRFINQCVSNFHQCVKFELHIFMSPLCFNQTFNKNLNKDDIFDTKRGE